MNPQRNALLAKPHLAGIAHHPRIAEIDTASLVSLDRLLGFLIATGIQELVPSDIEAFCRLAKADAAELRRLCSTVAILAPESPALDSLYLAVASVNRQKNFRAYSHGIRRRYSKKTSLPIGALPNEWQEAFRQMQAGHAGAIQAPAESIVKRLIQRLSSFAWSAQRAGRPINLADGEARRAYFNDLETRSAGLERNNGVPRYAYIRTAFEEMHRMARYLGLPQQTCDDIKKTLDLLSRKEQAQPPNKLKVLRGAPNRAEIMRIAAERLATAHLRKKPAFAFTARNQALAIMFGCHIPLRPEDFHQLRFGDHIRWNDEEKLYTLHVVAQKTEGSASNKPMEIDLPDELTPFVDAVLLQGVGAHHLPALRVAAMASKRPMIQHYDGKPAAYSWYGRTWVDVIGTGGHAMRTVLAMALVDGTTSGQLAIEVVLNHARASRHTEKYLTAHIHSQAATTTQNLLVDEMDDLSDLIPEGWEQPQGSATPAGVTNKGQVSKQRRAE